MDFTEWSRKKTAGKTHKERTNVELMNSGWWVSNRRLTITLRDNDSQQPPKNSGQNPYELSHLTMSEAEVREVTQRLLAFLLRLHAPGAHDGGLAAYQDFHEQAKAAIESLLAPPSTEE